MPYPGRFCVEIFQFRDRFWEYEFLKFHTYVEFVNQLTDDTQLCNLLGPAQVEISHSRLEIGMGRLCVFIDLLDVQDSPVQIR